MKNRLLAWLLCLAMLLTIGAVAVAETSNDTRTNTQKTASYLVGTQSYALG